MEIRIGVQHCSRELSFESEQSPQEIEAALADATATGAVLRLVDAKGSIVCVPSSSIGYVEIGAPRRGGVGFGML
ncbi:hypothetical protein KEM60_02855 [Austwickia sp. TVS 96-490-7B]|uniref:DUF3107 domain-containing protein n=1 Tax=Austwickia sp. TVS 96-490-7B TaxID=2830843 RepID=UPI001C58D908|nr:DUF3107 domain-containing protein [Austwickia sp. TVS 96-490-7B]MBW3086626.1 hypothetical protein [Austwickia sp. TVS 96-490-7B]